MGNRAKARRWGLVVATPMLIVVLARCDDSPSGFTQPDSDGQAGDRPAPVACFTTEPNPPEIAEREPLTLDAGCSTNVGSASSFQWDLGDGRTTTGSRVEARYRAPGEFTVRLRVQDGGVTSEATAQIRVRRRPRACFVFHQILATESEEPCTMVFDATCSSGSVKEYRWLFEGGVRPGDPPPAPQDAAVSTTEPHIVHSWREEIECFAFRPFERLVRLTVVDEGGATDSHEETVQFAVPMLRR